MRLMMLLLPVGALAAGCSQDEGVGRSRVEAQEMLAEVIACWWFAMRRQMSPFCEGLLDTIAAWN